MTRHMGPAAGAAAAASFAVLALASSCGGGSGEGLDANGRPIAGNPPASAAGLQPTLQSIQANVFTPRCAVPGCHGGGAVQAGLRLEDGAAAANLINVPSSQNAAVVRVVPGSADASLLIQKLEGTQPFGDRMPFGGPYLTPEEISVIRHWIADGAPP